MTALRAVDDEAPEPIEPDDGGSRRRRRVSAPQWLRFTGPGAIWAGIVVAAVGFALIGVAWGQVAGETQVYLQVPYLVSAGLTGLGLIMVGVTIVNVAAKRRDALERERQMDRLVSILDEVRSAVGERGGRRR